MKIKVVTIQMNSLSSDYEGNLSRAEGHIKDAISKKSKEEERQLSSDLQ